MRNVENPLSCEFDSSVTVASMFGRGTLPEASNISRETTKSRVSHTSTTKGNICVIFNEEEGKKENTKNT